jgi:hypothetical protein
MEHHVNLHSDLAHGASFREGLRSKGVNMEHLDHAQAAVSAALEKHGEEHLTAKNFAKVMEHARADSRWDNAYSSGGALEQALKDHLKIAD